MAKAFRETPAYDILFMELLSDSNAAAEFLNGIVPKEISDKLQADPQYLKLRNS